MLSQPLCSNPERVRQLLQEKDDEISSLRAQLSNADELKKRERALVMRLSGKEQEIADLQVVPFSAGDCSEGCRPGRSNYRE